ncbi:DedA family protein [Kocuria dechangensis]|uniref:DedA family protein n=1 Tax=Kocuria dechangensis TaxID=1176249 RepID=UPI0016679270|nr:DedA family protein [Kocuria dechangensis]
MVEALFDLGGWPVYAVTAVLVFLESAVLAGLFLPGETVLLLAGLLAGTGNLSMAVLLPVAVAAAFAGDQVGYFIGRCFGPRLRESAVGRLIGARRWERALELLERRGATAVFAARWITVVRALVPTVAGMIGMPRRRFFAANCAGALTWAPTVVLIGYLLGDSLTRAEQVLAHLPLVGVATVVLMVAVVGIRAVCTRGAATVDPEPVATTGDPRSDER